MTRSPASGAWLWGRTAQTQRALLDAARQVFTERFASGDAPPGFEVMKRRRGREWIGQSDSLLHLTDVPVDRVYAAATPAGRAENSACQAHPRADRRHTYTSPGVGHWLSSASLGISPGTGTRRTSPQPAWLVSARILATIHRAVDGSSVIPVATIASVLSSEKITH